MTHGTVRTYKIQLEGNNQSTFATITVDEDLRPHIGEQIKLRSHPNVIYKITRTIPSGAPPGDNTIYIVEHQSDLDKIAGGSVANFASYYLRRKKISPGDTHFYAARF